MKTGRDDGQATPHTLSSGMADLHHVFENMMQMGAADDVIAQQSHADRSVLIREVHHRVKNNLKLISSILSIHIREVPDDATRHILRRIQNRVNRLGTVHTDIYQHSSSGALPVARLLHEIADNAEKHALSFGQPLKIERDIEPAHLLPDQAIPLSLLVSEALDMVARLGKPQDASLHFEVDSNAVVTIRSQGQDVGPPQYAITPRFLQILATQLNGVLAETKGADVYALTFTFPIAPASQPVA